MSKKKRMGKCYFCEEYRELKWKWQRDKTKRICEACHLARQRFNEHAKGKKKGYWAEIKDGLKEFVDDLRKELDF